MKHFSITCDRPIGSSRKVLLSLVYLLKFLVNALMFKVWKIQITIEISTRTQPTSYYVAIAHRTTEHAKQPRGNMRPGPWPNFM